MMGHGQIEGGAPNNFLLMRNDRLAAPFGSTVKKGWLHDEREPDRLEPEDPTSESFAEMRNKSLNRNRTNVLSRSSRFSNLEKPKIRR